MILPCLVIWSLFQACFEQSAIRHALLDNLTYHYSYLFHFSVKGILVYLSSASQSKVLKVKFRSFLLCPVSYSHTWTDIINPNLDSGTNFISESRLPVCAHCDLLNIHIRKRIHYNQLGYAPLWLSLELYRMFHKRVLEVVEVVCCLDHIKQGFTNTALSRLYRYC